jgi:hypothetical protein
MTRESRIAEARRRAQQTSQERAAERASADAERIDKIRELSTEDAASTAADINFDPSIKALGPIATPHEWIVAVETARQVTIDAACRSQTITYGELRVAAYEATGMKVGHNSFANLAMETNRKTDECLLSSIIVRAATGTPGDGFLPYARSQGFDGTVTSIQGQVFSHFSGIEA